MAWCLIAALVVPVAIIGGAATLASASKTSKPTVALSSNVAGASPVTYTVGFTTSSSGSIPADGSITLVGPAGTVWPNSNSSYVLTDLTTSSGSFTSASSNSSADPGTDLYNWLNGPRGAAITIGVPNAIDAGDHLSLAISGVVNPEAGTDNLSVLTSSDETTATSASYTISAAAEVSKATVSLSSTAAGANGVTYAIGFNTSSAGAVPAGGSITLVAPAGTIWPDSHSAYVLTDSTTSSGSFTSASSTASGNPGTNIYNWIDGNRGAAVTIGVPNAINAGDVLSLVVNGVVNPPAGTDRALRFHVHRFGDVEVCEIHGHLRIEGKPALRGAQLQCGARDRSGLHHRLQAQRDRFTPGWWINHGDRAAWDRSAVERMFLCAYRRDHLVRQLLLRESRFSEHVVRSDHHGSQRDRCG